MSLEKIKKAIKRIVGIPTFQYFVLILSPFATVVLLRWLILKEMASPTKEQIIAASILSFAVGMAVFYAILNYLQFQAVLRFYRNAAVNIRRG